ncbi:hypothetical protein [Luteimonas deserti]|uniref:Uncharacterized protein n=1 Tax=Luteimonas deserti TaxID=2752306 RepID=A0A7Z0QM89_9GAMM|nr:hypothetical protein [Luteimonas deserti]NYZ61242.1 hypothetical protein [Luteimonas deserti]
MKLFRMMTVGALGYVAYRAWQRRQPGTGTGTSGNGALSRETTGALADDGSRTTPHGDPVLVGETLDVGPEPAAGSQSSRGFGGA